MAMKQIINTAGVLILIAVAIFGCLYIFGLMSFDTILSNLVKIVAAIVLLAVITEPRTRSIRIC